MRRELVWPDSDDGEVARVMRRWLMCDRGGWCGRAVFRYDSMLWSVRLRRCAWKDFLLLCA